MKAVSIIVGVLAAFVAAAPAVAPVEAPELEARNAFAFDLGRFNNFQFVNQDFAYLNVLNQFQFQNLHGLAINNGLNLGAFQGLFLQQQFDINSLIQISQLHCLSQVAQLGVFNNFALNSFQFQPFQLGLLQPSLAGVNLNQFITPTINTQIGPIARQQVGFFGGKF